MAVEERYSRLRSLYKELEDELLNAHNEAMRVRSCEDVISTAVAWGYAIRSSARLLSDSEINQQCLDWLNRTEPILSDAYRHGAQGYSIDGWDAFMNVRTIISDLVETRERQRCAALTPGSDELAALAKRHPAKAATSEDGPESAVGGELSLGRADRR